VTRLLILGGTGEARELAGVLAEVPGLSVTSSLAGRVGDLRLPAGDVRIGGFGGESGLASWLRGSGVDAVVDATHPFASRMTSAAVAVCARLGVPLLVLRRPPWEPVAGDRWISVDSLFAATAVLPAERVFLTIGRQGVGVFAGLDAHWFLIRSVEPAGPPLPRQHEVVLDRGPFTAPGEVALMRRHSIGAVVTKNSGGSMAAAKLTAARELGLPVVVVRRPPLPSFSGPVVSTVAEAAEWVTSRPQS
jgi:precorrin-6A/cobalt-precorrin-6A reductase